MTDRNAETLYLRRRVTDSLTRAAAAAGPCAEIAHLTLARLYGEAIDALVARPDRPTVPAPSPGVAHARSSARAGPADPVTFSPADREPPLVTMLFA